MRCLVICYVYSDAVRGFEVCGTYIAANPGVKDGRDHRSVEEDGAKIPPVGPSLE